jgi:hypothetical protein
MLDKGELKMWTRFMDMHSGGSCKIKIDGTEKQYIYIELPEDQAISYFERVFDRHPYNITCDCCGEDYSIDEAETLEDASSYDRQDWRTKEYSSVEEYSNRPYVLIIGEDVIKAADKSDNNGAPGTFGYFSMRD